MDLRLRKDHNSRCALEYQRGAKWVKYIAHTGNGPRIFRARIAEFDKDFNRYFDVSYDPRIAALRFLDSAKRAYEHDTEVLSTLLEIIMGKPASELSLTELVVAHNDIAKVLGKPPRKSFKSKTEALSALEKLDELAKTQTSAQEAATEKKEAAAEKRKAARPKAEGEPKQRGQGIGSFCKELISQGRTNAEILAAVQDKFPDAKTSAGCVAYYRNKMKA